MRRHTPRDDQWERIKDLLPGREGHVVVPAKDDRLFVGAVLYRYRAGIPWRGLPERSGDASRCTPGSAAGPGAVRGRGSSGTWPRPPTTSGR